MNKPLQALVFVSVIFCLGFFSMMLLGKAPAIADSSNLDIFTWQPPRRGVALGKLLENNDKLGNPFAKKLYESIELKGFMRLQANQWAAIFEGPAGEPIVIAPGKKHKGIELVFANGKNCQIKYGNYQKSMELKAGSN